MRAIRIGGCRLAVLACVAFATAGLAACAQQSERRPPEPLVLGQLREVTGTIAAVDLDNRLVAVRNAAGEHITVEAGPEVRNLEQVRVGDRVSVGYFEGIAADLRRPGAPAREPDETIREARAAPGERPAGALGRTVTSTVRIESVDPARHTVTFRRHDGLVRTLTVQRPESREFIRGLRAGDEVEVTYTEAVAIAVNPER